MIEALTPATAEAARPALVALLRDAVDSGASIGFLPPLSEAEAGAYWDGVAGALDDGSRVLLVARDAAAGIVGSVQLDLAMRANARHRAEVSKLMVHRAARRRGIGRALMAAARGPCPPARPHHARPRHPSGRSFGSALPRPRLGGGGHHPALRPERRRHAPPDGDLLQLLDPA